MKAVDAEILAEISRLNVDDEIIQVENKRLEKFALSTPKVSKSKPTSPVYDKVKIETNKSRRETSPPNAPINFFNNSKNVALLDIEDDTPFINNSDLTKVMSIKKSMSSINEKNTIIRTPSMKTGTLIKRSDFESLYDTKRIGSQKSPLNNIYDSNTTSPKINNTKSNDPSAKSYKNDSKIISPNNNDLLNKNQSLNISSPQLLNMNNPKRIASPFQRNDNDNSNLESLNLSPNIRPKNEPLRELFSSLHAELNPQFAGTKEKIQFLAKAFKTDTRPNDTISEKLSLNCDRIVSEKISLQSDNVFINSNPLFNSDLTPSSTYNTLDKFNADEFKTTTPILNPIDSSSPLIFKEVIVSKPTTISPAISPISEKKVNINNFIDNMKKKTIDPKNATESVSQTNSPRSIAKAPKLSDFEKLKEVIFDGYLMKKSPQFTLFPLWQNRYFRLYFDRLEYYSSDKDKISIIINSHFF